MKIGYKIEIISKTPLCKAIIENNAITFRQKVEEQIHSNNDELDDAKIIVSIDTKGEAHLNASAGIVLGDINTFAFSFLSGVKGKLGEGNVGFWMAININNLNVNIYKYYRIRPYDINQFLKKEIISNLSIAKFSFVDSPPNIRKIGETYNNDNSTVKKVAERLLFDEFQINNRNQLY